MGAFQVGAFIIKDTVLFAIAAGLVTYFILKKMLTKDIQFREGFLDALINSVIIGVIGYKASILLLRPELWTENLLGGLALRGSWREMLIGVFLATSYILWKRKRLQWYHTQMIHALLYGVVSFVLSYWLIRTIYMLI